MEYICMWIFKVGKFEYIDIWQVLSKKKIAGCWNSWKEIKKKKTGWLLRMTVGIVEFEKAWIVEFEKKNEGWKSNNKERLKKYILIRW